MAHGTPDWGLVGPRKDVYGLDDLGEHAVRLRAIPSIDRLGNVALFENFEHGLGGWDKGVTGAGQIRLLDCAMPLSAAYCLKLGWVMGDDDWSWTTHWGVTPQSTRLGFEAAFFDQIGGAYFETYLHWQLVGHYIDAGMRWDHAAQSIWLWMDPGVWTLIGQTSGPSAGNEIWHRVKFVVQDEPAQYVRAVIGGNVIDLSAHTPRVTVWNTLPWAQMRLQAGTVIGAWGTVFVDDVILTYDEP